MVRTIGLLVEVRSFVYTILGGLRIWLRGRTLISDSRGPNFYRFLKQKLTQTSYKFWLKTAKNCLCMTNTVSVVVVLV